MVTHHNSSVHHGPSPQSQYKNMDFIERRLHKFQNLKFNNFYEPGTFGLKPSISPRTYDSAKAPLRYPMPLSWKIITMCANAMRGRKVTVNNTNLHGLVYFLMNNMRLRATW